MFLTAQSAGEAEEDQTEPSRGQSQQAAYGGTSNNRAKGEWNYQDWVDEALQKVAPSKPKKGKSRKAASVLPAQQGQEDGRRGVARKRSKARRLQSVKAVHGGSQTWEQAEGADNSPRSARGLGQEGGAGAEGQDSVLPTRGRSKRRDSRILQAAEAEEQGRDTGGKARNLSRRKKRSVQREEEGDGEDVNLEYMT